MNLKPKPVTCERRVKTTKHFSKNRRRDAKFCVSAGVRFFLTAAVFAVGLMLVYVPKIFAYNPNITIPVRQSVTNTVHISGRHLTSADDV